MANRAVIAVEAVPRKGRPNLIRESRCALLQLAPPVLARLLRSRRLRARVTSFYDRIATVDLALGRRARASGENTQCRRWAIVRSEARWPTLWHLHRRRAYRIPKMHRNDRRTLIARTGPCRVTQAR